MCLHAFSVNLESLEKPCICMLQVFLHGFRSKWMTLFRSWRNWALRNVLKVSLVSNWERIDFTLQEPFHCNLQACNCHMYSDCTTSSHYTLSQWNHIWQLRRRSFSITIFRFLCLAIDRFLP